MSSRTARSGAPMRPVALMRGITVKARLVAVAALPPMPLSSMRASTPARPPWAKMRSPALTMARFSPSTGTTSATVPRAAKSAYSSSTPAVSPPSRAITSFRATPAPERSL